MKSRAEASLTRLTPLSEGDRCARRNPRARRLCPAKRAGKRGVRAEMGRGGRKGLRGGRKGEGGGESVQMNDEELARAFLTLCQAKRLDARAT